MLEGIPWLILILSYGIFIYNRTAGVGETKKEQGEMCNMSKTGDRKARKGKKTSEPEEK